MLYFDSETGRFYRVVDGEKRYISNVWEESFKGI